MTNENGNPERITKIEGAERLLKTAVDLFFENKDMLSIHTLSCAAHEVLHVFLKTQDKRVSFLKDNPSIRPNKKRQYHDLIHHTQNFVKHASKDRTATMKYYEAETPFWLFDAIQMYVQLTGSLNFKTFALFSMWFKVRHKDLLLDEVLARFPIIKSADPQYIKDNYIRLLQDSSLNGFA